MKNALFIFVAALTFWATAPFSYAQNLAPRKQFESNFDIGTGLFVETGNAGSREKPGLALRLSYGLDIALDGKWSLMPGFGTKAQLSEFFHSGLFGYVGGDDDEMLIGDVFCLARYRYQLIDGKTAVVGLGPQISYMIVPDRYYYDADPRDPINNKEKFHRWDIGLQPSFVILSGRHFQWGLNAVIGLRNMMLQYPYHSWTTGSIYLHNILFTVGWRF